MSVLDDFVQAWVNAREVELEVLRSQDISPAIDASRDAVMDVGTDADELIEDLAGTAFEGAEQEIIDAIEDQDLSDLDTILDAVDQGEQTAIGTALEVVGASLGIELAGGTQLETHQFTVSEIIAAIALEDLVGLEVSSLIENAIGPSLEARIHREHRTEFASLQDVVERQLRNKDDDEGWLSNLATYGIREEDVPVLEEAAITAMEAEELIETPAEAGVLPSEDVLQAELDRAGLSEDAKELFLETVRQLPKTARVYQEQIRAEELVRQLDQLVADGEIEPETASGYVPFLEDETVEELEQRWRDLTLLPSTAPSEADVYSGLTTGLIGLDHATTLLPDVGVDPGEHPFVLHEELLTELDGSLRTAVGLGLITQGQYVEYAELAGLDDNAIEALLGGQDLDDIAERRLQEDKQQGKLDVQTVPGIGDARSTTLEAAGIDTVDALAGQTTDDLTAVLAVSETTAQTFIDRASQLSGD